jgi:hypothetical protein
MNGMNELLWKVPKQEFASQRTAEYYDNNSEVCFAYPLTFLQWIDFGRTPILSYSVKFFWDHCCDRRRCRCCHSNRTWWTDSGIKRCGNGDRGRINNTIIITTAIISNTSWNFLSYFSFKTNQSICTFIIGIAVLRRERGIYLVKAKVNFCPVQ